MGGKAASGPARRASIRVGVSESPYPALSPIFLSGFRRVHPSRASVRVRVSGSICARGLLSEPACRPSGPGPAALRWRAPGPAEQRPVTRYPRAGRGGGYEGVAVPVDAGEGSCKHTERRSCRSSHGGWGGGAAAGGHRACRRGRSGRRRGRWSIETRGSNAVLHVAFMHAVRGGGSPCL